MSYSYSKLSCFDHCQFKYKLQYIDKLKTPFSDNATFEKGRFIHYLLEHYPNEPEYKLKYPEVKSREEEYRAFVKDLAVSNSNVRFLLGENVCISREENFYLDEDFKIIEGKTGSKFNGVIDYVGKHNESILLVDWKTGQTQDSASLSQLEFYSLWAFAKFPNIKNVKCYLMFVEQKKFQHTTVTHTNRKEIQNKYKSKIELIESTTDFEKNRTSKCQWCPFANECNKVATSRG